MMAEDAWGSVCTSSYVVKIVVEKPVLKTIIIQPAPEVPGLTVSCYTRGSHKPGSPRGRARTMLHSQCMKKILTSNAQRKSSGWNRLVFQGFVSCSTERGGSS